MNEADGFAVGLSLSQPSASTLRPLRNHRPLFSDYDDRSRAMPRTEALRGVGPAEPLDLLDISYRDLRQRARSTHARLIDVDDDILRTLRDRGGRTTATLEEVWPESLHRLQGILHIDVR